MEKSPAIGKNTQYICNLQLYCKLLKLLPKSGEKTRGYGIYQVEKS